MKYTTVSLKCLFFLFYFISCVPSHAAVDSATLEQQANTAIKELYHRLNTIPNISITERIEWISGHFKDSIYVLGSLGEGPKAKYDQFPRYRTDAFDCDTYVNTVVALALANSLDSFQKCLQLTRYQDGEISYINRNHFTDLDWNANNQQRGVFKDITSSIQDEHHKSVAQLAKTIIDKPSWYAHKTADAIRLQNEDKTKQEQLLAKLKSKGSGLKSTTSTIPYLPLSTLFRQNNEPNLYLFAQIPNGAIIEIVRPNWDLRERIGTALNISHLGFAIWINKQLYFRQASSQYGKVVDVLLIDYLKEALSSPTIKGINIQVVVPTQPTSGECNEFDNHMSEKKIGLHKA